MNADNILTKKGYKKLKEELEYLRDQARIEVAEKIKEAREEGGDFNENILYDNAVEEQGYIEGRISEIEEVLASSVVADKVSSDGTVQIGTVVVVEINGNKDEFTIVGSAEADPSSKCISNESPVGKALMGAKVGDEVKVETPIVVVIYKIVAIK